MSTDIYQPIQNEFYKEYTQLIIMAIERGWTKKDRRRLREQGVYVEEQHIQADTFILNLKEVKRKMDGWKVILTILII